MRQLISGIVALVVVSSIVSAGVFLGLRSQTVVQVVVPQPVSQAKPEDVVKPAVVESEDSARVAIKARELMEAHREELVRACLHGEKSVNLELRLIFNDGGKLIGYGVNDPPEPSLREAARCVRERRPDLSVDPIGHPATVQFVMALR